MANPQFVFRDTVFHGPSLLFDRREAVRRVTVKAQLQKLRDTGRYDCFKLQWHPVYDEPYDWPVPKSLFWDSDIAKWIEGACYFLGQNNNRDDGNADAEEEEVDAAIHELVQDIRRAQQADGYLNVYFTVVEPEARWSNIRDQHELYNAGHLIEAALAHHDHYHNTLLLEPIERYVRLLSRLFGPGPDQKHAYPGHPEIELALLRLYRATGNAAAYELARYFLEERGNPTGQAGMPYYDWEEKQRGDQPGRRPNTYPEVGSHWYCQAHRPIREQTAVEGHAVRAMYLLTGVADLLCLGGEDRNPGQQGRNPGQQGRNPGQQGRDPGPGQNEDDLSAALDRLWANMVDRKMSATGGIGAVRQWEGFGRDYVLPQGADDGGGGCYNETCAAIGVVMLAERLLHRRLDGRYGDVLELCLYNAVLTAMDLAGRSFTYVNPLASADGDRSVRHSWFACACCPPNLMRLFGSLGGYLWDYGAGRSGGEEGDGGDDGDDDKKQGGPVVQEAFVHVHLYTSATLRFGVGGPGHQEEEEKGEHTVTLTQTTNWPWEGTVDLHLTAPDTVRTTIRLRVPGWAKEKYTLEPPCTGAALHSGYLVLPPAYTARHPSFRLTILGFEPRLMAPHPYTHQDTLAVGRGPLVYCVEDVDNPWVTDHFRNTALSAAAPFREEAGAIQNDDAEAHAYVALRTVGWQRTVAAWWNPQRAGSGPTRDVDATGAAAAYGEPQELVFVPYYLRANRGGSGQMRVGLLRKP